MPPIYNKNKNLFYYKFKEENFMNKKLIGFQADVELVENTIKTFESLNCNKVDFTRFQHSLNALKEIDRETFDMFRLTISTIYDMTHYQPNVPETKPEVIERKHIPRTDTIDPESVRRAQDAFFNTVHTSIINNAAEPEEMCSNTNEMDATKEVIKPTPVYVPGPDVKVYPYNIPDTEKRKFEAVYYLPETGKFMGEYSGELKPYTYQSGSICINVAAFTHAWKSCKSKIVFVKNILRENGALPLPPKSTHDEKKKINLTFKNGVRFDFRLSNLDWTHGIGRTAESRDEEYLKRIIKDALGKLGENASPGEVFSLLNKEREIISVHMCNKLLPVVRSEVQAANKERQEAIKKLYDKSTDKGEDLMKYVVEWKKMFKHYPSKENIADIKKYLTEKGYLKPDFSPMAIKETIKLITGVSLSLKDVM
jgi:uncharacterized protein YdhG (YjbR/CyaY superfamily)